MGLLTRRQLSVMKWRAAFVALGVLAIITVGPRMREGQTKQESFRVRNLLQTEEEGSGMMGTELDEDPVDDTPSCDLEDGEFKSKLKVYIKQQEAPEKVEILCPADSKVSKAFCNDETLNYNDKVEVKLTFDECKTMNTTCIDPKEGGEPSEYIPKPSVDPMFPPDAFTEEQRSSGAIILHIIGILYMFLALALVCDHYFVPTLDVIIEKFGISPDVAGATFMAAGGSPPELFTSVIGVFIAVSDVGIGTIVGSAVFNVLFVIAACAFASAKALELTAWPLIRDTTFYSIALIVLVIFFGDDLITWWEALILFLWYFAYVAFMKFNESLEGKFLATFPSLKKQEEEPDQEKKDKLRAGFKFNPGRKPLLELMKSKVETPGEDGTELSGGVAVGLEGLKVKLQDPAPNEGETEKLNAKEDEKGDSEKGAVDTVIETDEEYVDYIRSGPEGGIMSKIMWYISFPLMSLMWITIPDPQDPKRKKFFPISFLISIVWIAIYSYFMVWWATLAGQALGISDAVMGLTFLAAGTSVPDLITSVLVAKEGKGDMAVSSSIGSNLFDVTVGLPLPWLLYTAINQKAMEVSSVGMGCSIAMLFVMLIAVFLSIIAFKWKMNKPMGGIMLLLYVVFVVVSLGLSECWFVCRM